MKSYLWNGDKKPVHFNLEQLARNSEILIDGKRVPCVRGVDISAHVGELTQVRIDLIPTECEVSGDAEVKFNGIFVTDKIARQIYEQLKKKFENKEAPKNEDETKT